MAVFYAIFARKTEQMYWFVNKNTDKPHYSGKIISDHKLYGQFAIVWEAAAPNLL